MKQAINILAIVMVTLSIFTITHAQIVGDNEGSYVTREEVYQWSSSFRNVLETLEKHGMQYIQESILPSYEADGRLDSIQIWHTATKSGARIKETTTRGGK